MIMLIRFWVNGNPLGTILLLDTTEASLIWWRMLMSSRDRTRISETSHLFRTYACTLDRSCPTKKRCVITCQSRFWGNTTISRLFPDLLRRLGILIQRMLLSPSRILLSMSLASKRGVGWSRRRNCGCIWGGTSNGSTVYPIHLWASLHPLLSTQLLYLLTRRLLLNSRFPTHSDHWQH